jgi:serine/threonine protein kinase
MTTTNNAAGPDSYRDPIEVMAESFVARFRRGERPSVEEYAARYPELADEVRELVPALAQLERDLSVDGATGSHRGLEISAAISGAPRQLGDYTLLREVGRGGMGIVYEAVQESLGRHVALKVLPQHRLSDPNQLERFRREARAAATLHHTNIVPVFGVGECDGVHHYAMQYIQGQSLDEVLREVKRLRGVKPAEPASSDVAGHDPALAMSVAIELVSGRFASQTAAPAETNSVPAPQGLPPGEQPTSIVGGEGPGPSYSASSIVGQSGFLYFRSVARIGVQAAEAIAYAHDHKVLHRDIKPSNLLLDLQGTVWVTDFGLAKTEGADALTHSGDIVGTLRYMAPERFRGEEEARSDVYALGLTMYEMLTLEPAFTARERARLIDKILNDEPQRPRQLDPRIPHDLETITLKAIVRDPSDRYRTALELAEDLRRYLADRPILARRASTVDQARRWCRRNPAVAGLATAVMTLLVVAVAILSVANVRITRERNAKDRALKLARANEDLATQQRTRAEGHLADAATVVDRMLTRVADEKLASVPQMEGLRKQLLEDAVQFYEEFLSHNRGNKSLQLETAKVHNRLSRLFHHLGDQRAVGDLSRQAIDSLEGLLAEDPTRVEVRIELAEALCWRGQSLAFRDDRSEQGIRESEECLRRYVALYEQLAAQFPDSADYRLRHIISVSRLAGRLGGSADAAVLARQAVLLAQRLVADYPDRWEYRIQLGESFGNLGCYLNGVGKAQEALVEFRKSFEILDSVPGGVVANNALRARSLDQLDTLERVAAWLKIVAAQLLVGLGRRGEAEPLLRESIAISLAAVADFPTFGGNHFHLAKAKAELGQLLADTARMEEGIRLCRESLDAYDRAIELENSRPVNSTSWLESCRALGKILERTGSLTAAEEVYRRGVRYADRFDRDAHDRGDSGWFDWILEWRCRNRWTLADLLRRKGATAEADRLNQQVEGLVSEHLA